MVKVNFSNRNGRGMKLVPETLEDEEELVRFAARIGVNTVEPDFHQKIVAVNLTRPITREGRRLGNRTLEIEFHRD